MIPRNDTGLQQAVSWLLDVPTSGVSLTSGPISGAFWDNVNLYLKVRDPLDMLYFFAKRAGNETPAGQCFGWDEWIKGSATGNYMMGAGGALRFMNDAQLRSNAEQVVAGIASYQQPNGWLFAFNESDIGNDNLPDYCASWVIRGLLDLHGAGVAGARQLAREQVSLFNNHSQLPFFLPTNGGPNPVQPFPNGFNNVTNGGYGQPSGHMIYIEYQGIIKHTLMALSGLGTQADLDIVTQLYQEDWWLQALLENDQYKAIWHRTFFSHNYEITAYEAYLDMYVLTGNSTYLQAMLNAWGLLRAHWILPGGSFSLNEGDYYPPDSYYIGFTGVNVASGHAHHVESAHAHAADPYYHAPCMPGPLEGEEYVTPLVRLKAGAMEKAQGAGPNDNDPPTGELCGSVFWTKFNQRFHRLYPDNETFVGEMERSILNVGVAALGQPGSGGQGPNGTGIRYFANQHKHKQNPSMHASCCEGQGTRLYGSLPEYVYTLLLEGAGVYVDLLAGSSIIFQLPGNAGTATLVQDTAWPYADNVTLSLTVGQSSVFLDLAIRIPSWTTGGPVTVSVGGQAWPTQGTPGTYLHLKQAWAAGTTIVTYSFPMGWAALLYSGSSQLPPYTRYAYTYGPVLMAGEGTWNGTVDALVMPASADLDPTAPQRWMVPAADGNTLHFTVSGAAGFTFKPYYEVQAAGEMFSVYPCF